MAALPVKSPDGETLALVSVGETGAAPALFVTYLDVGTGQIRTQADLPLPDLPIDTSLLVTPAFAADSSTLCLVLSITVPTRTTPVRKMDPESGAVVIVPGATWVSHHALAYFQGRTGEFVGPFDLDDSPSLARVNVAANSSDLFVWSIEYPGPPQRGVSAPSPAVPQVSAYPLGTAKARWTRPAPGPWPVNGEPCTAAQNGDILRLTKGTTLEVHSSIDGSSSATVLPNLDRVGAKPSAPTLDVRPDGIVVISAPSLGTTVVFDPALRPVARVDYPISRYPRGGPAEKVVLTPALDRLYALGSREGGGVVAFDVASGLQTMSFSDGTHFSGLHQLADGNLIAVDPNRPSLHVFDPKLALLGIIPSSLDVVAIF